jgi:hypothetical protein
MRFRAALRTAAQGARANLLPGLLLQSLMIVFLALYVMHEGTREVLAQVADLKHEAGFLFAFVSYVLSAALLPEILRIGFFQGGLPTRRNLWNFLTAAPAWGLMGMAVDLLYRSQVVWFGPGNDWQTILCKVLVDQFLFSPFFSNPVMVGYFAWRDSGFRRRAAREIFQRGFFLDRVFPVQVAGWCVWIPGVCLVYFMPSELQIPVASLIQAFWVLVFLFVNRPRKAA